MKKYVLFVFASLLLVVGSLHAQSVGFFNVNIPFDFVAGNTTFHAGSYTIQPIRTGSSTLLLRGELNESALITTCACVSGRTPERTTLNETKLVFEVVDGHYFLWQVWTKGYYEGRQLYSNRPEVDSTRAAVQLVVIKAIGS